MKINENVKQRIKMSLILFFKNRSSFAEYNRNLTEVEVWVQAIRVNGTWRYHDSTELTYTCLRDVTGGPNDNYMRARSAGDYMCGDHNKNYRAAYVCEIYIRDIWF